MDRPSTPSPSPPAPLLPTTTKNHHTGLTNTTTTTTTTTTNAALATLAHPPATSFPLQAAIRLLADSADCDVVYLLSAVYLRKWLAWAAQQDVPASEQSRLRDALLACARHTLLLSSGSANAAAAATTTTTSTIVNGANHHNHHEPPVPLPGPIHLRDDLGSPDDPLLLREDVRLINRTQREFRPTHHHHQHHARPAYQNGVVIGNNGVGSTTTTGVDAVAVPESFYEMLRHTHGVLCTDGVTVSFQKPPASPVLYYSSNNNSNNTGNGNDEVWPVEYRRCVVPETVEQQQQQQQQQQQEKLKQNQKMSRAPDSLMEKLVLQEQQSARVVELHPIRLDYTVVEEEDVRSSGCIMLSKQTSIANAVKALKEMAVPHKAAACLRAWLPWDYGPNKRTVYEVIPDHIDDRTLDDWAAVATATTATAAPNDPSTSRRSLSIRLETRKTPTDPWSTANDLHSRVQRGDCVDAQDVSGYWFEATVIDTAEDSITVHYAGWASRWNAQLKRYEHSTAGHSKLSCIRPLWSMTGRWRERLQEGDEIEVRDTSSLRTKPKWYQGIVRRLERDEYQKDPEGGAELETDENGKSLLLLGRRKQILVEVDHEKLSNPRSPKLMEEDGSQPPHLRWVYLFGEEICKSGTHLKKRTGPATLHYEVDGSRKPVEVMKSMHGAGFLRESLRGMPPAPGSVGLHNLGNSCFLNSIVQCMNHLEPLTNYFLEDKYSKDINSRNPLGSGGNVSIAYASLIKKVWAGNHSVLVPRLLKQTVASFAPQFDNSYQHDSQEFCQFLMDGLHEDLNRVKKKPYVEELEAFGMDDDVAAMESWRKHLLRHDSVIVDHCQGMHRSHLTCPQCGRESIKFDVYSSISLPIPTYKENINIRLQDCIDKFMETEQLDERDAYYCPSCRRHVCALKLIALWTVPDILILHLKRFTFDACISGGMLRSKVDNTVEFPINGLDLSKEVLGPKDPDAPPIYNLVGVSEHSGPTANSGHYTATVRNSMDNQWYRCNDSHVGRTSGEASITGGAYVLFYQRAKGMSKWGGMHRIMKERGIDPYGGPDIDPEGFTRVRSKRNKKK